MSRTEFVHFTDAIDGMLGRPKMTWEGPKPHDFRDMKARGVRFVHSGLYAKPPKNLRAFDPDNCSPDGKVLFLIYVGDDAAAKMIGDRISASGYQYQTRLVDEYKTAVEFEVNTNELPATLVPALGRPADSAAR